MGTINKNTAKTINKVNKVNTPVTKVNVNMVKPQITFIKRVISKHLITNKLNHVNNTKTKPQSITLNVTQSNTLQTLIKTTIKGLVTNPNYLHTTVPQIQYITNHLNTHTVKYLQVK